MNMSNKGEFDMVYFVIRNGEDDFELDGCELEEFEKKWIRAIFENHSCDRNGFGLRGTHEDVSEALLEMEIGFDEATAAGDPSGVNEEICDIVEVFEDFLDARGISIWNDDKLDDADASNLYGMDFAELYDGVEEILRTHGQI